MPTAKKAPTKIVNGIEVPRYLRIYDNGGESIDNLTICFTKKRLPYDGPKHLKAFQVIGASSEGSYYQREESRFVIDKPYGHLGKKIGFLDMPEFLQELIWEDYRDLWERY